MAFFAMKPRAGVHTKRTGPSRSSFGEPHERKHGAPEKKHVSESNQRSNNLFFFLFLWWWWWWWWEALGRAGPSYRSGISSSPGGVSVHWHDRRTHVLYLLNGGSKGSSPAKKNILRSLQKVALRWPQPFQDALFPQNLRFFPFFFPAGEHHEPDGGLRAGASGQGR